MNYFVATKYGVCIKMRDIEEQYKLSTVFPNGYKIFEADTLNETFEGMFQNIKCRDDRNNLQLFEVVDRDGNVVFAYFGTKDECNNIADFFKFGTNHPTKINTKTVKMQKDGSVATSSTTRKRMKDFTNFIDEIIISKNVDMENQFMVIPEEYRVEVKVNKSVKQKLESVDKDTTYLDDDIFSGLFDLASQLKDKYSLLMEQEEALKAVIRTCDLETMDILHNLELDFDKVNACQGYKISEKIHEVRQCRRRAKDKLEVITEMKSVFSLDSLSGLVALPEKLENRKYRNRNNTGMFDYEKIECDNLFVEAMQD